MAKVTHSDGQVYDTDTDTDRIVAAIDRLTRAIAIGVLMQKQFVTSEHYGVAINTLMQLAALDKEAP